MARIFLIVLVGTHLVGCVTPYAEAGLSYTLDGVTDYWSQTDRAWQCDNPQFHGEIGVETDGGWQLGLHHESGVLCGGFNGKAETYRNDIRINKKWGGRD